MHFYAHLAIRTATRLPILLFGLLFMLPSPAQGQHLAPQSQQDITEEVTSEPLRNHTEKFMLYYGTDNQMALEWAERAEPLIDSLSTSADHATILSFLATTSDERDFRYKEALDYKIRAGQIYERLGDSAALVRTLADMGRLHLKVGNYHDAFSCGSKARNGAQALRDTLSLREATMTIELVGYFYDNNEAVAMELNRQVADHYVGREQARQSMRALNNRFHYPLSPLQAEEVVARCEAIDSLYASPDLLLNAYLNMAMQQVLFGDMDACGHYLELSKPLIANFKDEGYYYSALGFYHINLGRTQQAIADTKRSIELLGRGDFDEKNVHSYFLLQELYAEQGLYREAHEALLQFAEIYTRQNSTESVVELSKLINDLERKHAQEQYARTRQRQSLIFQILTLGFIALALLLLLLLNKRKLERENRRLLDEKAEQELQTKNEIIKLQKLQQFQEQRNMSELTKELSEASALGDKEMRGAIKRIITRNQKRMGTDDWVEVERVLVDSNNTFFENLLREYPNLTKNERKLCTFIHLNLSTKEISNITHQSVGSINIARSRLRRKFGITGDDRSLITFLDRFK